MTDLTELRKIAEAATQGPWGVYDANEGMSPPRPYWSVANNEFHNPTNLDALAIIDISVNYGFKADADHIAAFDPPTVLALIDELEQLRRWKREAKQVLKGLGSLAKVADAPLGHPIIESAIDEIERLRGVVEHVRDLAESYPPIASTRPVGTEAIRIYERYVVARKILAILGDHLGGGMK